ncbi:MAG: hypothetical protein Q7U89_07205 [Coriobacteriia bacterium]|nr:hypothetical protein [Coriobacteriia bacterium]
MIEAPKYPIGDSHYRSMGLLANPFRVQEQVEGDVAPTRLAKHVNSTALLSALDASASDPKTRPVWVLKSDQIPHSYHRSAVSEALSSMSGVNGLGLLAVYVPLTMMRFGRVRSALSGLAERLGGPGFPYVLGSACAVALENFDESLDAFAGLEGIDLEPFRASLAADLADGAAKIFGPCEDERAGAANLDVVMRDSLNRQEVHEIDPEESDDDGETGEEDEPTSLREGPTAAEVEQLAVSDYVLAHIKEHISPVIARGLRVYRQSGVDAMAQEFKITRAPRKTLGALARFATGYYRAVVIVYDQLDGWHAVPDALRIKIVSTLSTMRWTLQGHGILAFAATPGQVPELEEQFAASSKVEWTAGELLALQSGDADAFPAIALWLCKTCASADAELLDVAVLVQRVQESCGPEADLISLLRAAGEIIDAD